MATQRVNERALLHHHGGHHGDQGLKRIMPLLDGVRHVDDVCTTTMRSHAELSQVFKAPH